MKVQGIDGKTYDLNPFSYLKIAKECSSYHLKARQLLATIFPFDKICEEVSLPGSKIGGSNKPLRVDFFIPSQKVMIEVQGEQHYIYNMKFFKNKLEFYKAKNRDRVKKQWCHINDIDLIELKFNEGDNVWEQQIRNRQ